MRLTPLHLTTPRSVRLSRAYRQMAGSDCSKGQRAPGRGARRGPVPLVGVHLPHPRPVPMATKHGFAHREACEYLGVRRKAFDKHIRPRTRPVRVGTCLIFDKVDLDRAWADYKAERNGRPGEKGGKHGPTRYRYLPGQARPLVR